MRTDKELMEFVKSSFPLDPSEEFIVETEHKLRRKAKKIRTKTLSVRLTVAASVLLICFLAFTLDNNQRTQNPAANLSTNNNHNQPSKALTEDPLVYIYQTHNYESFIPELEAVFPDKVFNNDSSIHETINITLVGKRLSTALKQRNINNIIDTNDNQKELKKEGMSYFDAYKVTRGNLEEALKQYPTIQMAFDLHRDSSSRNFTTMDIDGKDYAKIAIIVSEGDAGNPHYEKNKEFAAQFHKDINDKYPGLSRGIFSKTFETTKNHYNQDLLTQSVLIEIGGTENTLEEMYNTVEALANTIQSLVK